MLIILQNWYIQRFKFIIETYAKKRMRALEDFHYWWLINIAIVIVEIHIHELGMFLGCKPSKLAMKSFLLFPNPSWMSKELSLSSLNSKSSRRSSPVASWIPQIISEIKCKVFSFFHSSHHCRHCRSDIVIFWCKNNTCVPLVENAFCSQWNFGVS